jgi:cytochrome b
VNATSASPADARTSAPLPAAPLSAAASGASRRILDAPTRAVHWLMALCFLGAYLTADGERFRMVHVTLGYTLIGLVGWRVLWGLAGPRHSRLALWLGKLRGVRGVIDSIKAGRMPLQAGQNVLQAVAVLGLLVAGVLVTATGYALFAEVAGGRFEDALHAHPAG